MVTISRAEYEKLQAQGKRIAELENRVEILMEALRLERHRQFGASSEKISEDAMDQLSFLFNEAEVYNDAVKAEEESTPVVAHKRHKKHEYTLDNIPEGTPIEQIHHRLDGEALVCPSCGETITEIGTEVVRTLEIIPAKTVIKEHIYHTYACQKCSKTCFRRFVGMGKCKKCCTQVSFRKSSELSEGAVAVPDQLSEGR